MDAQCGAILPHLSITIFPSFLVCLMPLYVLISFTVILLRSVEVVFHKHDSGI